MVDGGCKQCEAFQRAVPIALPQDFYALQERVLAGVKSGVLAVVSGGLAWSDVVECELACVRCGAKYNLICETYHGSGGRWEPTGAAAGASAEFKAPLGNKGG